MIVGDTNLLVYFYIESEFTHEARQVNDIDPDWVFPPVALSEATNVLATLTSGKRISAETAAAALALMEPRLAAGSQAMPMDIVLKLAIARNISAYDAQFITLARQISTVLVTEDGKLQKLFPDVAVSMKAFIQDMGRSPLREPPARYGTIRKRRGVRVGTGKTI
jgi:predicted nucleic acid-binding protein